MKITLLSALLLSSTALADPTRWVATGPAERAVITGGPWVLAEGTAAAPTANYPAPNPGTNAFAPYYHPYVVGDDSLFVGWFDYRPKDLGEAIVAAYSTDRGRSWTFQSQALTYTPPSDKPNDDGLGHPFVMDVGGRTLLYTLDREPSHADRAGLIVHEIFTDGDPLAGAPGVARPGATDYLRTDGLANPDGIIDVVGGWPTTVLYLAKDVSVRPNVTTVHLADSWDGVHWENDRLVDGLATAARPFIGPRGTLLAYSDGSWGLFFSAGLPGEDADALHFIGYAESSDLQRWTVINDVGNPILSTEASKDPTGGQPWYAGRVYAPSVVPSDDGCAVTMMFAGYKTLKPKNALNDYRQIGRVELTACGSDGAKTASLARAQTRAAAAPKADAPSTRTRVSSGCSVAPVARDGAPLGLALLTLSALLASSRARRRRA